MKKITLLSFIFMVSIWTIAQSLELYFEGELLLPDAELTMTAHPDSGLMVLDTLDVKNISNTSIDVKCVRTIIDTIPGQINSYCWGLCYAPFVDTSSAHVTIAPNAASYEFSGDHDPAGVEGVTKVKYTFYDMNNPEDKISVFVSYDATAESGRNELFQNIRLSDAYPNPANSFVSVDYDLPGLNNAKIVIFNLLGSIVKEIELTDTLGTLKVNTSNLLDGIYFYSLLINNEATKTQKLIIKH